MGRPLVPYRSLHMLLPSPTRSSPTFSSPSPGPFREWGGLPATQRALHHVRSCALTRLCSPASSMLYLPCLSPYPEASGRADASGAPEPSTGLNTLELSCRMPFCSRSPCPFHHRYHDLAVEAKPAMAFLSSRQEAVREQLGGF